MSRGILAIFLTALLAFAPAAATDAPSLWNLYRRHDFFALQAALASSANKDDPQTTFLRAATASAFGRFAYSSAALRTLLSQARADRALEEDAREALMLSERARFHYPAALDAVAPLLRDGNDADTAQLLSIRNRAALLTAIIEVLPELVYPGDRTPQVLTADGAIGVRVNGLRMRLLLDTGANFSVLSHSAARDAGLKVRTTDYKIEGATGTGIRSDVASGLVKFGDGTIVSNVVFLVLPDSALRLPDGRALSGLIGLPVILILGSIRYLHDGRVVLAENFGGKHPSTQMALFGSDPLLQIEYRGRRLICRLDTGAARTTFYPSFLRTFPEIFASIPRYRDRLAGVSGAAAADEYRLPALRIILAGRAAQLRNVRVFVQPTDQVDNGIFCNIGRDVLGQFDEYVTDFTHMSFSAP
jgi:hypothetical protein